MLSLCSTPRSIRSTDSVAHALLDWGIGYRFSCSEMRHILNDSPGAPVSGVVSFETAGDDTRPQGNRAFSSQACFA
jgi:hypothetical protein